MRRRIFEDEQPDDEVGAGLEYKVLELVKFKRVGRVYPEFGKHNESSSVDVYEAFEAIFI